MHFNKMRGREGGREGGREREMGEGVIWQFHKRLKTKMEKLVHSTSLFALSVEANNTRGETIFLRDERIEDRF